MNGHVRSWENGVEAPSDIGIATCVSGGGYHAAVVRKDGSVRCWGENTNGQCDVPENLGAATTVDGGGFHTVAILASDCDSDGIGDGIEIAAGTPDFNLDTIPDTCQCLADLFVDRQVNGADLGVLLSQWGRATASTISDMNRDGLVNGADLGYLLANWGPCTN
jgi:hypothetical protein